MIRGILNFLIANFVVAMLICCRSKTNNNLLNNPALPLVGSWQLITAAVIQNGDTVVTAYNKNISFIKIINETHFSFQQHDLHKGKDSDVVFVAGGGKYTLQDSLYKSWITAAPENGKGIILSLPLKLSRIPLSRAE